MLKNIVKQQYRVLEVQSIFPITYPYEWSLANIKMQLFNTKNSKLQLNMG